MTRLVVLVYHGVLSVASVGEQSLSVRRYRLFYSIGLLLVINWLSVFLVPYTRVVGIFDGYVLGSIFAHATLAAAWAAFGTAPLKWRLRLSFGWMATLLVSIGVIQALGVGSLKGTVTLVGSLVVHWILAQLMFWAIDFALGVSLRNVEDVEQESAERIQFGIRHLLIVMVIAGALLGTARIFVTTIYDSRGALGMYMDLSAVSGAMITTAPLLLASLSRRFVTLGVLLAFVLTVVATFLELQFFDRVPAPLVPYGPLQSHFIFAINASSTILILIVAVMLTMNGYYLCPRPTANKP